MQLLSSENQNLPLKIPCKKVAWLLVGRKNTSVVRKACRSWITKSASRAKPNIQQTKPNTTKPNLQQTKPNTKSTNIQQQTDFSVTAKGGDACWRWVGWVDHKTRSATTSLILPFTKIAKVLFLSPKYCSRTFSFSDFPPQTFKGNQEQHNPKNYSRHFRVTIH